MESLGDSNALPSGLFLYLQGMESTEDIVCSGHQGLGMDGQYPG